MAFDNTKPDTSQTYGDAIASARNNDVAIKTQMDAHEANAGDAHGLAAILTNIATLLAHMANTNTAHGIDGINSSLSATVAEINAARGIMTTLQARLGVALASDGSIKLSSLASKWIDNSDTPSYVGTTSFTVPNDRTKVYIVGSQLRVTIGTGYVYAPVSSVSYSAGTGLTTVNLDAGYPVLAAGMSKVELALIAWDNAVANAATQNATDITNLTGTVTGLKVEPIAGFSSGVPAGSAVVHRFIATRAFSLPIALAGSQFKAGTAATASAVINLAKNGSNFATATFAAAGTVATLAAATATSFAAGDILTITAPASADATLANLVFNLKGSLT